MRPSIRWFIVAVVAAAACKGTEPFVPVATTVTVTPGAISFTAVGPAQPLAAAVLDQRGNAMQNPTVTWSTGNSTVATVDQAGIVTSRGNGSTQITATSGLATGNASVNVAQVAAGLLKYNGDGQTGSVGTALPTALTARLVDSYGSPVSGITVTWTTTTGSLSTPGGPSTDVNGLASATWTLGTTSGLQQATAAAAGVTSAVFAATANAGSPASVVVQAGDNQQAAQSTPVAVRPAVQVRDQYNNLVSGAAVSFAVDSGGGSVTGANPTTNGSGIATVGSWTVGTGNNTLIATVSGTGITGNPVKFHATGVVPGPPTRLIVTAGNGQAGLVGYALNVRPAVEVVDAGGFPVPNKLVTFTVTGGGGSVTGDTMTTGLSGIATVGSWTVQLGANTLSASIPDAGVNNNPLTFSANGVTGSYNIVIRPLTAISAARLAAFDSAAAHWERLIYGDVPDLVNFQAAAGTCTSRSPAINETVDDIIIFAILDSIDGPGKILGQAGPCWIRSVGFQPIIGVMFFDTADVHNLEVSGLFDEVVTHEMGHVLGFGTIWSTGYLGLIAGAGGSDPHFIGTEALAAFDRIGAAGYSAGAKVPVENTGGAGTRDSHWREAVFGEELMTGYLGAANVAKPLSVVTVASMGDEGYQVNYAGADAFSLTFAALRAQAGGGQAVPLVDDILRLPIGVVDARGRFVRWVMPR